MAPSEQPFIDLSKWNHCLAGQLHKWLRLLWPPHCEEDDGCIVRGLFDSLACSAMYRVVPTNAHSLRIYKTRGSHLVDEQPTQTIVRQQHVNALQTLQAFRLTGSLI